MKVADRETFGQRVKAARLKRGIRQVDLAAQAGISWRHLIRIEQDAGGVTKDSTVERIAKALGVDAAELSKQQSSEDDEEGARPMAPRGVEMLEALYAQLGMALGKTEVST